VVNREDDERSCCVEDFVKLVVNSICSVGVCSVEMHLTYMTRNSEPKSRSCRRCISIPS